MAVADSLMGGLKIRAAQRKRRIIFPEQEDPRVLEAVRILKEQGICEPVLLSGACDFAGDVEIFTERPDAKGWREKAIAALVMARGDGDRAAVEQALQNPLLLAAALLRVGYVDGGVAGSIATTADVVRSGFRGVGLAPGARLVSGAFLMESGGRVFTFGDCVVNPCPDAGALAQIAIDCAQTHSAVTGESPKVGMLSFSTKGSAEHDEVGLVREALALVRRRQPDLAVDGELQFDAAFVPAIAAQKAQGSTVAGSCNVFVFPNLSAGNIGYKIAERMAGARAVGPVLQGLAKPWMDLSRGCGSEDVVNAAVISAILTTQPVEDELLAESQHTF